MRRLVLAGATIAALVVPILTAAAVPAGDLPTGGTETVCFVPTGQPEVERTIRVPSQTADRLVEST
ncbi:MAG: hypothetical protein ACRDOJ_08915, partial [Nocardioidaceae bacterium]